MSLHATTDEDELVELRDQLSLNQMDYNIYKSRLLEMIKFHNKKYNITTEQYDSQEDCLYAVNEYKQTVMEEHKRGKSLRESFDMESNQTIKNSSEKELTYCRIKYSDMKYDLSRKIACYNANYINKVENALII